MLLLFSWLIVRVLTNCVWNFSISYKFEGVNFIVVRFLCLKSRFYKATQVSETAYLTFGEVYFINTRLLSGAVHTVSYKIFNLRNILMNLLIYIAGKASRFLYTSNLLVFFCQLSNKRNSSKYY